MKHGMVVLSCLLVACGSARAEDSVAAFYKSNPVHIVVGVAAGSGYDINARILAQFLGAHIPGRPNVIVQNQPGAGSVTMTNALYKNGPADGTTIGAPFQGLPTVPFFEPGAVRFDPSKLIWLGSTNRETDVTYVWNTSPVQRLADLQTKTLLVGAQAPGTSQFDFPAVANAVLGLKFKIITGYEGTPQIHAAMERGEIQGVGASAWTSLKAIGANWLATKKVKVIAQWGLKDNPELKDVPNVMSLAKNEPDQQALRLMLARLEYGRPFFLPPGVPADRVAALRKAFDDTMKDPAYRAAAEKAKLEVDPLTGAEVADLIQKVSATPPEVVKRVKAALDAR